MHIITVKGNEKVTESTYINDFDEFVRSQMQTGATTSKRGNIERFTYLVDPNKLKTKTRHHFERLAPNVDDLISRINTFYSNHNIKGNEPEKKKMYTNFRIPKAKQVPGEPVKYRYLVDPHPALKAIQADIANVLNKELGILVHNSAHGFSEGRSPITNARVHQTSKHILKMDLDNFFPSINKEIIINALNHLAIFGYLSNFCDTKNLINMIADIATLNDEMQQGSPLSPVLSNLIMMRFDYEIVKVLTAHETAFKYTRYVDDMIISSKRSFDITEVVKEVTNLLSITYHNKIKLNYSKTKKLNPGKCWITGVKLNQNRELSYGHEKKAELKARIHNMIQKHQAGTLSQLEAQETLGHFAFFMGIEPHNAKAFETKIINKYSLNITKLSKLIPKE